MKSALDRSPETDPRGSRSIEVDSKDLRRLVTLVWSECAVGCDGLLGRRIELGGKETMDACTVQVGSSLVGTTTPGCRAVHAQDIGGVVSPGVAVVHVAGEGGWGERTQPTTRLGRLVLGEGGVAIEAAMALFVFIVVIVVLHVVGCRARLVLQQ